MNLECGSATAAQDFELKFRNEADTDYVPSSPYMTISQTEFSTATTSLTINGTVAGGSVIKDVKMHLVSQQSGQVKTTLMVKVLPLRTVTVGVYSLEDPNSPATQFATAPAVSVPSADATIVVLNDSFKQAGVQFVQHASSGIKTYPYDTQALNLPHFNPSGPTRAPDGKLDWMEQVALQTDVYDTLFGAGEGRRIFYVKNSGISYGPPYDNVMIRGNASGVVFAAGASGFAALAGAHEIGHNLNLADADDDGQGHDLPPYAPGVDGQNPNGQAPVYPGSPHHLKPMSCLMGSGSPSPTQPGNTLLPWLHGRWFRHEDWQIANVSATP